MQYKTKHAVTSSMPRMPNNEATENPGVGGNANIWHNFGFLICSGGTRGRLVT